MCYSLDCRPTASRSPANVLLLNIFTFQLEFLSICHVFSLAVSLPLFASEVETAFLAALVFKSLPFNLLDSVMVLNLVNFLAEITAPKRLPLSPSPSAVKVLNCTRRLKLRIISCEREEMNGFLPHAGARELVGDHNGLCGALGQRQLHLSGGK